MTLHIQALLSEADAVRLRWKDQPLTYSSPVAKTTMTPILRLVGICNCQTPKMGRSRRWKSLMIPKAAVATPVLAVGLFKSMESLVREEVC